MGKLMGEVKEKYTVEICFIDLELVIKLIQMLTKGYFKFRMLNNDLLMCEGLFF